MTNTTKTRTNKYAADCFECDGRVPAGVGTLERLDGAWVVRHIACDRAATAIDTALAAPTFRPAVCPRHGNPIGEEVDGICWECEAELEIAHRDRTEYVRIEFPYGSYNGGL